MNIGIVTSWFERGSAYVSRQYMDALHPAHRVFIYCRGGERKAQGDPEWDKEFVTWGPAPLVDEPSAVDLEHFGHWLTERKIECVLFNEQRSWLPVILCAQRGIVNGAFVVHYREDTIPFFHCHDFLICNARHHAEVFCDHPQSRFIPWGTDLSRFRPAGTDPVTPGRVTFFHSAGMNPHRKGTDLVVDAFAEIRPGEMPVHLVLHTQLDLSDQIGESFARLEVLREQGRVTLVDRTVPDLADLYRMGDVCVYPTRHEGLGLTVVESLASGLPILVTDQLPVSEHADGSVVRTIAVEKRFARPDGDYWPQSVVNVTALRDAMAEIAGHPEDLGDLKLQARAKAELVADWSKNAADLPSIFANWKLADSFRKSAAVAAALKYEEDKYRLGLRNWVGSRHPWLVRSFRALKGS